MHSHARKSINGRAHSLSFSFDLIEKKIMIFNARSKNCRKEKKKEKEETRFIEFALTTKATQLFYTNSLIRLDTKIKGGLGKNHGLFHLLTRERRTPWIRHRGEEKHDRESNYKLEEFNLIEGVRAPTLAKLHKAWSKSGAATMRTLSFRNEHLPIRRTIRHPFLAAGLLFFIPRRL